ncbi:MAG: class I adenylate-forming enzyme family protein, partial [Pseudomonadota bacterium]
MNLGIFLDQAVARYNNQTFLHFYERTLSFSDFGQKVDSLAHGLKRLGFNKGDIVYVHLQNSPETLISYFAIQKIGAIAGPINGWWKGDEIKFLLNDSRGSGLIIEDQYLETLQQIRPDCPHLKTVVQLGEHVAKEHISFDKLLAESQKKAFRCECDFRDIAYIFYTSGTTGKPKGVLLSHKNVLADIDGITKALDFDPGMTVLCFLPLFHVNAMLTCSFCVGAGSPVVLRKGFSASEFWEVVDKYKVSFWSAVPAVYQILLNDPSRQKHDLSSLKFGICGAAPLTKETMNQFEKAFQIPIVEGYGLTEATCVSTINPRKGKRKIGSIGLPIPGQEIKIVDEEGNECEEKQPGEILIKGDAVMGGYFERPEETKATIKNGFLHTGDVGYKDEDGYIFIVDRKKDMIIRGGENIYPKELDDLLATHPMISEAATIGVPDKTMGEAVKVFVLPANDALTEDEVLEFCKQKLAAYKVPQYVEILKEDLPRNAIGKVLKKILKQWGIAPRPKKDGGGVTVEDIFGSMESRVNAKGVEGVTANYGYKITGTGGGEWTVSVKNGVVKVTTGIHEPNVTTTMA